MKLKLIIIIHYIKLLNKYLNIFVYTLIFKIKLRIYGCHYGRNIEIDGSILLKTKAKGVFNLGEYVRINSRFASNLVGITNKSIFQSIDGGKITIGNFTGITSCIISSRESITIGNNTLIGANCRIFDHDFHNLDYLVRRKNSGNIKSEPVLIEDDVFVGTNSIILKGVRIGARTIIGAGSVVSIKIIPPDSLVAGNPARIIKKLNSPK